MVSLSNGGDYRLNTNWWGLMTILNKNKCLLGLICHPNIGIQTIKKILLAYDNDIEKAWGASSDDLAKKLDKKIIHLLTEARNTFDPNVEIEKLAKLDVGYVTMYDKAYPELLKQLYDFPPVLFIKGNIEILKAKGLGVVGSRKYSSYGAKMSHKFSKECAEHSIVIVSGLALGIDAIAHQAAVDAGTPTIGVLGCGLDRVYPVSNYHLGEAIIRGGGAIVSEYPLGTPPMKQNFPQRNRIIAGLSVGTLVIEAAEHSGALITAYSALENNRDVFAIPGNIDSETSFGTNELLKKGAKLVTKVEDILEEMNVLPIDVHTKYEQYEPKTPEEKLIFELLKTDSKTADEMVAETKMNVIALNATLSLMELGGVIQNIGGGRYKLK